MCEGAHKSIRPIKEFDVSDIKLPTYFREPLPVVGVHVSIMRVRELIFHLVFFANC